MNMSEKMPLICNSACLLEIRVGAQIGKSYWCSKWVTPPLATFMATEQFLQIALHGEKYIFQKEAISCIAMFTFLGVHAGFRLQHSQHENPPYVTFGTSSLQRDIEIARILKNHGFPCENV